MWEFPVRYSESYARISYYYYTIRNSGKEVLFTGVINKFED
jgi:hypothetical protein